MLKTTTYTICTIDMTSYFKDFIHFILRRIVTVFFNFNQLNQARDIKYITVLTWFVLCWLILCTGLVFLTFFWRRIQCSIHLRNSRQLSDLETDLISYLYDDQDEASFFEKFCQLKGYKRQLFFGLLVRTHTQFIGHLNDKVRRLTREIMQVNVHNSNVQVARGQNIEKFLASYSSNLPFESLVTITGMEGQMLFELLNKGVEPISDWEQIQIHHSLRMLRHFDQQEIYNQLPQLLNHPDEDVRAQTVLNLWAYNRKACTELLMLKN